MKSPATRSTTSASPLIIATLFDVSGTRYRPLRLLNVFKTNGTSVQRAPRWIYPFLDSCFPAVDRTISTACRDFVLPVYSLARSAALDILNKGSLLIKPDSPRPRPRRRRVVIVGVRLASVVGSTWDVSLSENCPSRLLSNRRGNFRLRHIAGGD